MHLWVEVVERPSLSRRSELCVFSSGDLILSFGVNILTPLTIHHSAFQTTYYSIIKPLTVTHTVSG